MVSHAAGTRRDAEDSYAHHRTVLLAVSASGCVRACQAAHSVPTICTKGASNAGSVTAKYPGQKYAMDIVHLTPRTSAKKKVKHKAGKAKQQKQGKTEGGEQHKNNML